MEDRQIKFRPDAPLKEALSDWEKVVGQIPPLEKSAYFRRVFEKGLRQDIEDRQARKTAGRAKAGAR